MIKIIIELKENNLKKIKDASIVDCDIAEIEQNATKLEQKTRDVLKGKLGINEKVRVIKNKEDRQMEAIKSFIESIFD